MAATGDGGSGFETEDESSESDGFVCEEGSSDLEKNAAADSLPAAQPAAIARKRSFARSGKSSDSSQNSEAKRVRVSAGKSTAAPRRSTHDRIAEFPGEYLSVSAGKLYCTACNLTISIKHSIVKAHVNSQRHVQGKESKKRAKLHQQAITISWKKFSSESTSDLAGSGLSQAVSEDVVRRANVVETFLKAGIPLSKVDYLRPLLESGYGRLTYSTHMAQLIPFLHCKEEDELKKEISGAPYVAVIFDGTSRLGEALAVVLRYVDADLKIHQRFVRFHVLAKSLAGLELSCDTAIFRVTA